MIESIKVNVVNPDGTKTEFSGDTDAANGYHNFLIGFNALIDLDFAILKMIQSEYNNPKFINQEVMSLSVKGIKMALINRDDPNPVTVCVKTKETADSIYNEIMNTRYMDLIGEDKYLTITGIFFLVSVYTNMDNIHINVLCTCEEEANIIKKYHSKVNTIIMKDPSELDLEPYTEFIFKNKNDVFKFKNKFVDKRVIFLNYKFNVTFDDVPYPDVQVAHYLWETGLSRTAIIDTYRKEDPDYATLIHLKKKPKNN